jgi:hypothetical protein
MADGSFPRNAPDAFDLWHIYRMIGKLSSRIYLLSAPG